MYRAYSSPLHPGQSLLNRIIDKREDIKNWVITTPRQWGKTTYLLYKAMYFAINNPGSNIWYVSPFDPMNIEVWNKKLLPILSSRDPRFIAKVHETIKEVTFKTDGKDSYLKFRSAANPDGLRGGSLTHLICDEFAYIKHSVYKNVLVPMMARNGKKALLVSTPFGKNHFYDYYNYGLQGASSSKPGWGSFRGTAKMTRDQNYVDYIAEQRSLYPPNIFRQEYEAAFIDSGGAVFKNIDRALKNDLPRAEHTRRNFIGIDLGQENDRTVLVVLNERGEIVRLRRFEIHEQQDSAALVDALAEEIKTTPGFECYIEENFNSAIANFIRDKGGLLRQKVLRWKTTAQNKNKIINELVAAIDRAELVIPQSIDRELIKELQDYTFKFSGQTLKYGAPDGGHDDCVMALAFAWQCYSRHTKKSNYIATI